MRCLFADYAHLSIECIDSSPNCDNTSTDCTNFFVDYANKSSDCANTPNDWVNIHVDSVDTLDKSSLDLCISNPSLLQLLFKDLLVIYKLKINIMLTVGSSICFSSSVFCIYGFYIS
jgi:hypothetical protein